MDTRVGRRNGQEILYCKPDGSPCTADGDRELVKDLRERFWIEQAQDEGAGPKSWTQFEFIWSYPFGRQDVGKNRNQPGDGFRYVFRSGLAGSEGRAEWSEVTEVFEGVDPKDIEAFMRTENGLPTYSGFSPHCFLSNLNLGIPRRAAQRRAADKVIEAVDKKVRKSSYINMPKEHGYGTLIVGLPLWFAPPPRNPLRVENVIDNFETRVGMGLLLNRKRLRRKDCPFWRIVVVWRNTAENLREWKSKTAGYNNPVDHRMRDFPVTWNSLQKLLDASLEGWGTRGADGDGWPGATRHVVVAHKKKKGKQARLPTSVADVRRALEKVDAWHAPKVWKQLKLVVLQVKLQVGCFVMVHGLGGLWRWAAARVSPTWWVARLAKRQRAMALYRASWRRGLTRRN